MDGGGYFCMSITTIKRSDLSSYKRITMCKSCGYEDPHDRTISYDSQGIYTLRTRRKVGEPSQLSQKIVNTK